MKHALALLVLLSAASAQAQSLVSTGQSFVTARLEPGARAADGSWLVGLALDLAPGWKTYWRAPGETGIPPRFDWTGSVNLAGTEVSWPRPHVFDSFGATTLGYSGQVVWPIRVTPQGEGPVSLRLALSLGVCEQVCVLEEVALTLDLGPDTAPVGGPAIAAALAQVPGTKEENHATCRIVGSGAERRLEAALALDPVPVAPMVVVEAGDQAWVSQVTTAPRPGGLDVGAAVTLAAPDAWIDRSALRMTVLGEDYALDIKGCSAPRG